MHDTIAAILKQLRKSSHISVKQAVSRLQDYGIDIASKTLYGYESGLSMPNADVFVALCSIYQCENPTELIEHTPYASDKQPDSTTENTSFHPDELSFLHDFQELDSFGQDIVRQILEHEKERMRQAKVNPLK